MDDKFSSKNENSLKMINKIFKEFRTFILTFQAKAQTKYITKDFCVVNFNKFLMTKVFLGIIYFLCFIFIIIALQMGVEASSETSTLVQEKQEYGEEEYELQDSQKISINDKVDIVHVWIDREINNEENVKHYKNLKDTIKIQRFTSVRELKNKLLSHFGINQKIKLICAASLEDYEFKQLQNDSRIISIVLFCQNEQRAELLKQNFSKVIAAFFTPKEFYNSFMDKKYQTQIKVEKLSILFYPSYTNMINKFRLNYNCMCLGSGPKQQAKADFIRLCEHLFPNKKAEIGKFDSELKIGENMNKMILKWAFDSKSFFWEVINKLPKITLDCKRLGYLRLPFFHLYKAILEEYNEQAKKSSPPSKLYIVSEVNENQQQQLKNNKQPFLTFTTFVKGFTSQKAAMKKKSTIPNAYIFEIDISRAASDKKLDFGFVIDEGKQQEENIIFNLYNFFNIDNIVIQNKCVYARYGGLAYLNLQRLQPSAQRKLTYEEQDLLRNYDYLEDLSSKIHSQANILQMSGYFQDAIKLYKKRTQDLVDKNVDKKFLDKHYLQLAEAYKMNQQYRIAEKTINKIQTQQYRLLGKIVLVQVFLKKDHIEKMNQQIQQLRPLIQKIKGINLVQYFRLQNLIGVSMMKANRIEEAKKHFQDLLAETRKHYGFKYQGIPIVHDVMRNIAITEHRFKNKQQAIKMLENVKRWQNACQGAGPSLALTQAILNSIHYEQGASPKYLKSRSFLQSMGNKVTFNEIDYVNANVVVIDMKSSVGLLKKTINQKPNTNFNLNESLVSVDFVNEPPKNKASNVNLNESSVNVDFANEPPKKKASNVNLNESSVNVDFNNQPKTTNLDQSAINVNF